MTIYHCCFIAVCWQQFDDHCRLPAAMRKCSKTSSISTNQFLKWYWHLLNYHEYLTIYLKIKYINTFAFLFLCSSLVVKMTWLIPGEMIPPLMMKTQVLIPKQSMRQMQNGWFPETETQQQETCQLNIHSIRIYACPHRG